jgi:phosphoribosylamine-glycine ligase
VRICVISRWNEGGWFAYLCKQAGHEVMLVVEDEHYRKALRGLIDAVDTAGNAADYDLIVYDSSGMGKDADASRLIAPTIGGSQLADKLEHDRVFGIQYMERCGIRVPVWEHFHDISDGIRYIKKSKRGRFVFKPCGDGADVSCTYVSKSAEDLLEYIDVLYKRNPQKEFILQEFAHGTEVSTEMWVNESGYHAINFTIEAKQFMAGDIGPNTGCAGNLVWMPNRETTLFQRGLKKAYGPLRDDGFVGMIDLNTIVTDEGILGLEWTPRFGYEGSCNLTRLLPIEFGDFMYRVAANETMPDLTPKHSFCASVRLAIPPYPLSDGPDKLYREGVPISGLTPKVLDKFYARDVRCEETNEDKLETAGVDGWIGSVLAVGPTIHDAFCSTKEMIDSLKIPDMMYRNDIESVAARRYLALEQGGWLRTTYGS